MNFKINLIKIKINVMKNKISWVVGGDWFTVRIAHCKCVLHAPYRQPNHSPHISSDNIRLSLSCGCAEVV